MFRKVPFLKENSLVSQSLNLEFLSGKRVASLTAKNFHSNVELVR